MPCVICTLSTVTQLRSSQKNIDTLTSTEKSPWQCQQRPLHPNLVSVLPRPNQYARPRRKVKGTLNPKELFERALQGSDKEKQDGGTPEKGESSLNHSDAIDGRIHNTSSENKPPGISAKTVKALVDEDMGAVANGGIR